MDRNPSSKTETNVKEGKPEFEWMMMHHKTTSFDDVVAETIEEVIRNVFKDEMAKVILEYFENSGSKRIDERLQVFSEALPKILGVGSVIIQDLILENLYSKFELQPKWKKDCSFKEYILELKSRIGMGKSEAQSKIVS